MKREGVLIISEKWWPEGGGAELATHLIAEALSKSFDVTIVHGTLHNKMVSNARMIYTSLLSGRIKHKLWVNTILLFREKWFIKLLENADLIYIPRIAYPAIPLSKRLGKAVVVHLHDYQPISYNSIVLSRGAEKELLNSNPVLLERLSGGLIRSILVGYSLPLTKLARLMVSRADRVVCVSEAHCKIILSMMPEILGKCDFVYNPLPDIPRWEKSPEPGTFIYVGGGNIFKGFYILLNSIINLIKNKNYIRIFIAGKLDDSKLRLLVKLKRLYGNPVKIIGYTKRKNLFKYHLKSYGLIFPSILEEPLPYAVVESMLMRTVPIASRVGGIPEIIKGTYAERLLFSPGGSDELAERLEEVLHLTPADVSEIGHKLRSHVVNKFSEENTVNKLTNIFYKIIHS